MRKLKVNDFFRGCGGLGIAFQEAEKERYLNDNYQ